MTPSASARAIATCRSMGLSYAGPVSARYACLFYRMGVAWRRRFDAKRPCHLYASRVARLTPAYFAALAAERAELA